MYKRFFEGGLIQLGSEEVIEVETLSLIKRFGEVFAYAHQRGEELKQKEAQNRRLAVEASVPKCSRWTKRATSSASCRC